MITKLRKHKNGYYLFLIIALHTSALAATSLIMLAPAGHAGNPGRLIVESYERGITYQIAEALQKKLQSHARVVLSRNPGEELRPLQVASFANRLNVSLFVSIHCYRSEVVKPQVHIYHLLYDPMVDFAPRTRTSLNFVPIHQAHFQNIDQTRRIAEEMKVKLSSADASRLLDVHAPVGMPFLPLKGVVAPAIAIEIGLHDEQAWKSLIDVIAEAVQQQTAR